MRLLKYIELSGCDKTTNKFRAMDIKLVKDVTEENADIVKQVAEEHKVDTSILNDINQLNRELKNIYSGKKKFWFCLDEGEYLNDIKRMNKKNTKRIRRLFFETCDSLGNLKTQVEKKIIENN